MANVSNPRNSTLAQNSLISENGNIGPVAIKISDTWQYRYNYLADLRKALEKEGCTIPSRLEALMVEAQKQGNI